MKEIVKTYGSAIFYGACLILTLLMVLWMQNEDGSEGMLKRLGRTISVAWSQDDAGGFETYEAECTETFPDVAYQAAGTLVCGSYELGEVIKAFDGAGNLLDCKIDSIKYPDGSVRTAPAVTSPLIFEKAGIYELTVRATDGENRKAVKKLLIPVNKAG